MSYRDVVGLQRLEDVPGAVAGAVVEAQVDLGLLAGQEALQITKCYIVGSVFSPQRHHWA